MHLPFCRLAQPCPNVAWRGVVLRLDGLRTNWSDGCQPKACRHSWELLWTRSGLECIEVVVRCGCAMHGAWLLVSGGVHSVTLTFGSRIPSRIGSSGIKHVGLAGRFMTRRRCGFRAYPTATGMENILIRRQVIPEREVHPKPIPRGITNLDELSNISTVLGESWSLANTYGTYSYIKTCNRFIYSLIWAFYYSRGSLRFGYRPERPSILLCRLRAPQKKIL